MTAGPRFPGGGHPGSRRGQSADEAARPGVPAAPGEAEISPLPIMPSMIGTLIGELRKQTCS